MLLYIAKGAPQVWPRQHSNPPAWQEIAAAKGCAVRVSGAQKQSCLMLQKHTMHITHFHCSASAVYWRPAHARGLRLAVH